ASQRKIPILIDAARKREQLDELLNFASYIVWSAKFPQAVKPKLTEQLEPPTPRFGGHLINLHLPCMCRQKAASSKKFSFRICTRTFNGIVLGFVYFT
ncbi:hypothetical protein BDA96_08G090900, partial [Sorghum bicolor]